MKETCLSFCSFDSTWLLMVRFAKGTTTTQPAFIFFQNEDGNLCLPCSHCSACLFHCCLRRCQLIVCVTRPASVVHMTRGASVMWLHFLLFLCKFFIPCLLLFLMFLSWEIWGMNMNIPNLPEVSCLEDLPVNVFVALALWQLMLLWWWLLLWDEYCCDTHNVLTTPLSRSPARPLCGFATALLVALEGRLSCERFGASQWYGIDRIHRNQWWLRSCPSRLAMALLPVVACCNCA